MKKTVAIIAAVIVLIAAGITYYYYSAKQADLPQVKIIKAARAQIEAKVYTTGKLDMQTKQEVRVLTPGLVKNVPIKVGDQVKQGALLVELDSSDLDLQLKQAQAGLAVAKAGLASANERLSELQQAANSGQSQLPTAGLSGLQLPTADLVSQTISGAKTAQTQAQAVVNQAQAALDVVQNQKNKLKLTSNLDGTVLAVNVSANQAATPQIPLAIVGDLGHLIVQADVNEVDAGKLAPGQPVKISGATLGDREFSGKVLSVAPIAESQQSLQGNQTTVPATIAVDQSDPALKPGFSVSLTVTTASKPNVLQIPQEAIFTQDKIKYVYIVRQGVLSKSQVTTGISGDVNVEILSGINEGDQVVLNPSKNLSEGLKVRVD